MRAADRRDVASQGRYTYIIRMQKKLTISVDADVYDGLHSVVGRRRISRFINDLARPHVTEQGLEEAYRAMAADEAREADAAEWTEGVLMDVDESRRR